jgi:hypothetical protein
MIYQLNSVGCVIDTETLNTYPMLSEGGYDTNEDTIVHVDDCTDEWFNNLSNDDFITIKMLLKLHYQYSLQKK